MYFSNKINGSDFIIQHSETVIYFLCLFIYLFSIREHSQQKHSQNIGLQDNRAEKLHLQKPIKTYKLLLHPFNGLLSRTTWVSRYQKGKTCLDLNEAKDDGVLELQWHQLDHMQTICSLLQTDNHTNAPSVNFFTVWMLFLTPNQQCQSTEGKTYKHTNIQTQK